MPRRKINLPLIEVIGISLVLHVAALLVLGGLTVWQVMQQPEPEFEAPPPPQESIQPQELKVRLKQTQKQSSQPRRVLQVQNISQMNLPQMDINMPTINSRVAVSTAGVGGGIGRGLGGSALDMSKSAVNFFGIRSSGEKIAFLIDASDHVLIDQKGGLPSYNLIKAEVTKLIEGLAPGSLFNIIFFNGHSFYSFSPSMQPATTDNKKRATDWIKPINTRFNQVGKLPSNLSLKTKDVKPLEIEAPHYFGAIQAAMEMNADAVFLIAGRWFQPKIPMTPQEAERHYRRNDWGDKEQQQWREAAAKAREWLNKENAQRRARGIPEKVIGPWGMIAEWSRATKSQVRFPPPTPNYDLRDLITYFRNLEKLIYKEQGLDDPEVNVILFLGEEEADEGPHIDAFKRFARANGGKFRVLNGLKGLKNVTGSG